MVQTGMNELTTEKYKKYISKQKVKTLDPEKQKKWLGVEWKEKLDAFNKKGISIVA